jgi:hypothetical protein
VGEGKGTSKGKAKQSEATQRKYSALQRKASKERQSKTGADGGGRVHGRVGMVWAVGVGVGMSVSVSRES